MFLRIKSSKRTYFSGNSWGTDENGISGLGKGPQEEFYACADIAIGTSERLPTLCSSKARPSSRPGNRRPSSSFPQSNITHRFNQQTLAPTPSSRPSRQQRPSTKFCTFFLFDEQIQPSRLPRLSNLYRIITLLRANKHHRLGIQPRCSKQHLFNTPSGSRRVLKFSRLHTISKIFHFRQLTQQ